MTIKELIEELQELDPNRVVVVARDPEGNGFTKASDIEVMSFHPDSYGYDGYVKYEHLTEKMIKQGYTEEDISTDGEPCIVIWP